MNKLNIFLILLLSYGTIAVAQVGVGTDNPQEALHVSGVDSTIRVDGLSSSNDSHNLGGTANYNLMVNSEGSMTLGKQSGELLSVSNLATPVIVQTQPDSGLNASELYTRDFILEQRALVVITYYVAIDFKTFDGTNMIDDGRAKVAHNYFFLGDGAVADTAKSYGMTSVVYSNVNCDTATGYIYNSRSMTIALEAGTHSIHLQGAVYGGGLNSDAAFSASFGNGDRLDVQAIYL